MSVQGLSPEGEIAARALVQIFAICEPVTFICGLGTIIYGSVTFICDTATFIFGSAAFICEPIILFLSYKRYLLI